MTLASFIAPGLPLGPASINGTDIFGIVNWVSQHRDGFFSPKQELRLSDPEDVLSPWMLYANQNIEEGEVLATIPWSMIIAPNEIEELGSFSCDTARLLADELALGETSRYGPFVQYLNTIPGDKIPSLWSTEGKELLADVMGGAEQQAPPGDIVTIINDEWYTKCQGGAEGVLAASLVMKHGIINTFMVPTADWYTHRNGKYFNVHTELLDGKHYQVRARRPIYAGEPLHNSYDRCDQCDEEAADAGYGTPELFRDHGFIEQYPQRWTFLPESVVIETEQSGYMLYSPQQITFDIVESEEELGAVQVEWADHLSFDDRGRNYVRRIFRKELKRLYRVQNIHYNLEEALPPDRAIPTIEWKAIQNYYHALRSALHYAVESLVNVGDNTDEECKEEWSSNEGACETPIGDAFAMHYDDLKQEEDNLNYIFPTCETTQLVEFESYTEIEELDTNYQKLWFVGRESDGDICMNLEDTLQICSNYRPHYHEFFVHYPARFIEKVERVIFIGGGDSMLLHEVLKYPTLEKVVGLELDQQVTRKSFEHFRTQPHWDNNKVEWWYGDATKSLPLLPQDYWGSFDLVLVDLSETVMSFAVTQTMDIFSALSLLLKPEGIMVKNEPYIDQFSEFFDYNIQLFYGSPKICTQVLVMGSNKVDFLHHPTKEHHVERLLLEPLDNDEHLHYKYMHDYRKSYAEKQGKCTNTGNDVATEHGARAGLVEILEAENTTFDYKNKSLGGALHASLVKVGLTPLSPPSMHAAGTTVIVMKEGYIVARPAPELKYIAFDINLWGAFSKMESVKSSILKAVGSQVQSSYRIVVGGMFGSNTWEEDKDAIGIQVRATRNCEHQNIPETSLPVHELKDLALTASLEGASQFGSKETKVALVVCGFQGDSCTSANILSELDNVRSASVWACPTLSNRTTEDFNVDMIYDCERGVLAQLFSLFLERNIEIDMFVIDSSAPLIMGQIFHSIWSLSTYRAAFLSNEHIFVSLSTLSTRDSWTSHFMERYRKEPHELPVSRAQVSMVSGNANLKVEMLAVNNRYFFQDLHDFEADLRSQLVGFYIEATDVTGGVQYFDSEYDVRVFGPESYDRTPALTQAMEQRPLGRQSIFQFELKPQDADLGSDVDKPTLDQLNNFLQSTLEDIGIESKRVHRWDTYKEVGDGCAIVCVFPGGHAILVWDGAHHADINLFTENQSKGYADSFVESFASISMWTRTLRDDQPRGPGRVVQFGRSEVASLSQ